MKNLGSHKIAILVCFAYLLGTGKTNAQTLWSEVKLDHSSVYVGEPIQVTISVFTSTWFTKGVDPGNIKVNGAFTVYFRPLSTSKVKDGKTYSGVQLFYHVFPYEMNSLEFPTLSIEVETPKEGGYKGEKKTLKTEAKHINVKPIPPGMDKDLWLVANDVTVNDTWSSNLKNAKVGDVLERSIQLSAGGTVSELIPPFKWDSISGLSLYPTRSIVNNQKSKTAIGASRKETMRFLLEEEGEIQFPEFVFRWYNPSQQKMYKRTLKAVTIQVQPNPDLGMLASIRDSLQLDANKVVVDNEDQQITIFGLTLPYFIALVIAILLFIWGVLKIVPNLVNRVRLRQQRYLQSELYFFKQFVKAARKNDYKRAINAMYEWLDRLHLYEPTAQYFTHNFGNKDLQNVVYNFEEKKGLNDWNLQEWKKARQSYLNQPTVKVNDNNWINP